MNNFREIYKPSREVSITPLVTFRIVFGLLMFFSLGRFWWRGWIDTAYVQPKFHFTYQGFEWVQPWGSAGMHFLFALIIIAALFIALGLFYKLAAVIFFLGFTYVELIDITTYLNHYYFISLVAFLLIWLPANCWYSIDAYRNPAIQKKTVPAWTIDILRYQLAVVYIFAGLAKLNYDWLIEAQPMRIWLPAKSHLPVIGKFLYEKWVAYSFSWIGAAYDLFIVFFLWNKKTRPAAYVCVVLFHAATALFFPVIGMFPYVMIVATLIFFSESFHEKLLSFFPWYKKSGDYLSAENKSVLHPLASSGIIIYVILQILIPLRFIAYPGHLFWHEEGYRFSWRVMLMEKAGAAYFTIKEKGSDRKFEVNNQEFLTPLQEKMMSTQPDLILRYAHFLAGDYRSKGIRDPEVYAEIYVTLNGRRSTLFIDSTRNLAKENISWKHYNWVLPYKENE